jgi:hypothetical protein
MKPTGLKVVTPFFLGQTLSGVLSPHKQGEKLCIKVKIKICARFVPEGLSTPFQ